MTYYNVILYMGFNVNLNLTSVVVTQAVIILESFSPGVLPALTQIVQTRVQEGKKKGISGWVILLLILGAPVWLPLLIAVLAVLFALFVALWAVVIALWAAVGAIILTGIVAIVAGVIELIRVHLPQGLVLLGGGLACLGLCALLFLLMKLVTVGTVKLCKWLWIGIKSLFVGKKSKE